MICSIMPVVWIRLMNVTLNVLHNFYPRTITVVLMVDLKEQMNRGMADAVILECNMICKTAYGME